MRNAFLYALLLTASSASAQEIINSDTTWDADTVLVTQNTVVPSFVTLTIAPGTAVLFGAGVNLHVTGSLVAEGTSSEPIYFSGIDSTRWGGIYFDDFSQRVLLKYCNFFFGGQDIGGAIRISSQQPALISRCKFMFNVGKKGGAVCFDGFGYTHKMEYCLVANNHADVGGGVYVNYGASVKEFIGNTISDNTALETGGFVSYSNGTIFANNIVWGNSSGDLKMLPYPYGDFLPTLHLRHCLVGGNPNQPAVGLISSDPLFKDPSNYDYGLSTGSPAVDKGCHCKLDADGSRSDIGYQPIQQPPGVLGYTILDSLNTRNVSLTIADHPYVVCTDLNVRAGEWLKIGKGAEVIFAERNSIKISGQVTLEGAEGDSITMTSLDTAYVDTYNGKRPLGWDGIDVQPGGRLTAIYTCFQRLGFDPIIWSNNFELGKISAVKGTMTFDHCRFSLFDNPNLSPDVPCIYNGNSITTIRNCSFKKNRGNGNGVLIISEFPATADSKLTVENSEFQDNDVAGLIRSFGATTIRDNTFSKNDARNTLFIYAYSYEMAVEGNRFVENKGIAELMNTHTSSSYSWFRNNHYEGNNGTLYFYLGRHVISGNIFKNNRYSAENVVNGYSNYSLVVGHQSAQAMVVNNTFADNNGHITLGRPYVVNNIFHNNLGAGSGVPYHDPDGLNDNGNVYQNNVLEFELNGPGNISANPRFLNGGSHLAPNSPAIDNGSSALSAGFLLPNDLLGNPRATRNIDMGALEFMGEYLSMVDIVLSDTIVERDRLGEVVANIQVNEGINSDEITFSFVEENGLNNNYFTLAGSGLVSSRELADEELLRVKIRAQHSGGAWLEQYFFLTVQAQTVVGTGEFHSGNIVVYPVPANNVLFIDNAPADAVYHVVTTTGIVAATGSIGEGNVDIGSVNDGLYILRVVANGLQFSRIFEKRSGR